MPPFVMGAAELDALTSAVVDVVRHLVVENDRCRAQAG
jgi:hypothetical protein